MLFLNLKYIGLVDQFWVTDCVLWKVVIFPSSREEKEEYNCQLLVTMTASFVHIQRAYSQSQMYKKMQIYVILDGSW